LLDARAEQAGVENGVTLRAVGFRAKLDHLEEQTQRADRLAARLRELGIEPD